jgi:hypothetical protein
VPAAISIVVGYCSSAMRKKGFVLNDSSSGMQLVKPFKTHRMTSTKKGAKKTGTKKAATKKGATKKVAAKKATSKKAPAKKTTSKKAASKKGSTKKNKLGVKNSLVNNINAKKKKGTAKPKQKSTVSKKSYKDMENNWGKK